VGNDQQHQITVEEIDSVALVRISRPERMNAINRAVVAELRDVLGNLDRRYGEVRVLVITGEGDRAFISGGDIAEMNGLSLVEAHAFVYEGQELTRQIERLSAPVIAAVNGYALGGGTEIALACDIRIASDNAVFGLPEVSLGLLPGWGGTQRMQRVLGIAAACDLVLTGRRVNAEEAMRLGLVSRVVPNGELVAAALGLAHSIAANSPIAVRQAKKVLHRGADIGLDQAMTMEAEAWLYLFAHQDRLEGTAAFLEKRRPRFSGS
jgi:enoyl-CoA hydratase/carnithine racemase